jgi:DNA polymerase (family 10)
MDNARIVSLLEELGVLLDLQGESPFKSRAYTNAARTLRGLELPVAELVAGSALGEVRGIGKALEEKLTELVTTGRMEYYERQKAAVPPGLLEVLRIPGLGPRRARTIHHELGIASLVELEAACLENRLLTLEGFGAKSQEKILDGIAFLGRQHGLHLYAESLAVSELLLVWLRAQPSVLRAEAAGDLRRRMEVVEELVLVAATQDPEALARAFAGHEAVETVTGRDGARVNVTLKAGLGAELHLVDEAAFAVTLWHLTGNDGHRELLRARAKRLGLQLGESGLCRDGEVIPCPDEAALFAHLGIAVIPPELREGTDEVEAGERSTLPALVTDRDVKGILHVHTTDSDGHHDLVRMAEAAQELGYAYLGVCDHSQAAAYARGLTPERVREQHEAIDALNARLASFRVLKGIEVDILADGALDFSDDVLASFDFTVASIHSNFGQDRAMISTRIERAMHNPHVRILGHPTGRLLLVRDGYAADVERLIDVAAETGTALELNANPRRLDLDWRYLRRARDRGVKIAINPDAHRVEGIEDVAYGVAVARKGWIEAPDVLNCWPFDELVAFFRGSKRGTDWRLP